MNAFISYAREDAEPAKRLYDSFRAVPGIIPWLDSEDLLPGSRWKREIMQTLAQCDYVILLLSGRSVSKEGFIQKEIREALDRLATFPPEKIFLIPARLDDCIPRHEQLEELHWVDLFPDWKKGVKRIIHTLLEAGRPATSAASGEPDTSIVIETLPSTHSVRERLRKTRNLRGCDMMDLDLSGLDFSRADLRGANLVGCNFTHADFTSADLAGANCERADLTNADVSDANLWGVNFWGANLLNVKGLTAATVEHTNFYETRGLPHEARAFLADKVTMDLPDYGSFRRYFEHEGIVATEELQNVFIWMNHSYFRYILKGGSLSNIAALLRIIDQQSD